jgi:transcriptional regulator of heat shock response
MEALEEKGFLSHLHTSSGRVPTKKGFKCYVERLNEADLVSDYATEANFSEMVERDGQGIVGALDILAQSSGYASFLAVSGKGNQLFFSGTRFILEQPEFEDISRLKNVFYALEVKMQKLQELLLNYFDERLKILIGDDIGFEEISDCSLVVCGSGEDKILFTLALLGPMRMDYIKAVTCLCSVKGQLKDIIGASL